MACDLECQVALGDGAQPATCAAVTEGLYRDTVEAVGQTTMVTVLQWETGTEDPFPVNDLRLRKIDVVVTAVTILNRIHVVVMGLCDSYLEAVDSFRSE